MKVVKRCIHFLPLVGLVACVVLVIYARMSGVFDSTTSFRQFMQAFGSRAIIGFICLEIVQVIVPIVPGGISTVGGLVAFGTAQGLLYSYIGLVIGSIIGFSLVRFYGDEFLSWILSDKKRQQFQKILDKLSKNVKKVIVVTFLIPFAPDDLVCLAAGLSTIRFRDFLIMVLLLKPVSIFLYGYLIVSILHLA